MISSNCKKSEHDNCSINLNKNKNEKCDCSCHRSNSITQKLLEEDEDKHGITRQDELMAETLP
jgi:hypothetical protein